MGPDRARVDASPDRIRLRCVAHFLLDGGENSVIPHATPTSKLDTPLTQKQADLAREESHLREEMEKLERMIKEAPRAAEETSRRQREELLRRASEGGNRLDVSLTIQDKRFSDDGGGSGRHVSMRKNVAKAASSSSFSLSPSRPR